MSDNAATPAIAGLSLGVAFVVLFAIFSGYPISYSLQQDYDYTPLLQLDISGLRNIYMVGEGIDFSVSQTARGTCVMPELVQIKDLDTGRVIKEWNGTAENTMLFGCPFETNPATSGTTWISKWQEANPIIINQTGTYSVVAKHLFKTVHKEFRVAANDNGSGTSAEAATYFTSLAKNMDAVKALLEKYPDANSTVTANYYSKQFQEF